SRQKVIIDAGAIALSKDLGPVDINPICGYGRVLALEGNDLNITVREMSQEHGVLFVEDAEVFERLKVGMRVRVLANHSCLTAAQHSHYSVLDGENVVDRWKIH